MLFGKLMKRLLGVNDDTAINDDPFGSRAKMQVDVTPPPARVVVHRDEAIDERSRIAGYRFHTAGAGATAIDERVAALRGENIVALAQRRLALLPLTAADWARADFRQFVAAQTHFLVATPTDRENDAGVWLDTLRQIRDAGGRIALDDSGAAIREAADLADLIVLDFRAYALDGFERLARRLRRQHPAAALAADGIGSWPEHRLCQSLGIRYSLGGFATTPDEDDKTDKLNQSRLVLIEMLNLLRGDAELTEIVAVAKRDPGVAVKIVGMANSPVSGLSAPVASLDQAMLVLGRGTIYRWLSIAMFRAGSGGGRDEALLELALWRARFLELVCSDIASKQERDELFLVGLLSLIDSLLGQPMARVLARMNLPQHVAEVLLSSDGPYGRFLLLALAVERGRDEQALRFAASLDLPPDDVEAAARTARAWAEAALGSA